MRYKYEKKDAHLLVSDYRVSYRCQLRIPDPDSQGPAHVELRGAWRLLSFPGAASDEAQQESPTITSHYLTLTFYYHGIYYHYYHHRYRRFHPTPCRAKIAKADFQSGIGTCPDLRRLTLLLTHHPGGGIW